MPVKAPKPVRLFTRGEQITESVLTEILGIIGANTSYYVPIDTGTLINGQFRQVERSADGFVGRIGYTQAYAAALHERTDWRPRPPGVRGKKGGGFNPNAQDHFLARGVEESRDEIKQLLVARYGNI